MRRPDLEKVRRATSVEGEKLLYALLERPDVMPFPMVVTASEIPERAVLPSFPHGPNEPPIIETYELQPEPLHGNLHYRLARSQRFDACPVN